MELLMNTQKECQQLEVYGEYLKKIPELLKQLETVEKMYQKAVLEEAMLKDKPLDNHSVQLYAERLHRIKEQCEIRRHPSAMHTYPRTQKPDRSRKQCIESVATLISSFVSACKFY